MKGINFAEKGHYFTYSNNWGSAKFRVGNCISGFFVDYCGDNCSADFYFLTIN